jgi:hypothetical protein
MATEALPLELFRRRVSLAGQLTWDGPSAAQGCELTLQTERGQRKTEGGSGRFAESRAYKARIRDDGLYFFENVAPGIYRLTGQDRKGRTLDRSVTLPPAKGSDRPPVTKLDLQFTATPPADISPAEVPAPRAPQGRGTRTRR